MNETRDELAAAIGRIAARVLSDPDVIAALRALLRLVAESDFEKPTAGPSDSEPAIVPGPEPEATASTHVASSRREPVTIPLTLGQVRPAAPKPNFAGEHGEAELPFDLETIARRARLKAEGVRWSAERRRRIDAGEDFQERIAPGDRDIVDRARALSNCWIWMNNPQVPASSAVASDPARAGVLALAYEVAALAAELLNELRDGEPGLASLGDAMQLAAEAQSTLRVLVEQVGYTKDCDQFELYSYLRQVGERHHIYIKRFMRLDDPADPARLTDLRVRIEEFGERVGRERGLNRDRKKLLSKLRYHARVLHDGGGTESDRRKVVEAAAMLVESGLPPSSPSIRDHVAPILDELAMLDDLPPRFQLVRRELDHYRDLVTPTIREPEPDDEMPIPEVSEVASLLRGRSIVMICNVANPDARDALLRSFELTELDWIEARAHQSIERFKPNIARPDVALVLLPIRWSSHSFGELKSFCEGLGKPFVQLPGGYNVNQVAVQILNQASEKLRASAAPEPVATA